MRVLISGAGIAGPTLAWFLARRGAQITVVEKTHALLPHGQNVDIEQSAIKVIERMGLLEEVRRYNTTEKGTQFIDPSGRPFAPFPVGKGHSASPTSEFEILRGDLAKILYEATKSDTKTQYMFATTIKEVISNDEQGVKVLLSNGDVREFDLLVAADGQWSKTRRQCFPQEDITVIDKDMYAVYWTTARLQDDNDWWNIYQALGSRLISVRPDPHGTIRAMFTSMPCNEAQRREWQAASRSDRKTQQELLRKDFSDAGWQATRLLNDVDRAPDFYFQPIQQIKMSNWQTSRIVCLGDAAYAPSPLTGMGTSLALIGAYILAGEISKLHHGQPLSGALQAYEDVFRPHVERIQQIPSFVPGIAHPQTAFKRWLFQTCIWAVSKIVTVPWIMRKAEKATDDSIPLPRYPQLDEEPALKAD